MSFGWIKCDDRTLAPCAVCAGQSFLTVAGADTVSVTALTKARAQVDLRSGRTQAHGSAWHRSSSRPRPPLRSLRWISLRAGFRNRPAEARPLVRWWWFGPAVTKPEIERELQGMKADGIGGVEFAFVYPLAFDDPPTGTQNLNFLSPSMLEMVQYAQAQGRSMGMRVDVTLCSGWPYGGPHITLALAATSLRTVEVAVPSGATDVSVPSRPKKVTPCWLPHWSMAHQERGAQRTQRRFL